MEGRSLSASFRRGAAELLSYTILLAVVACRSAAPVSAPAGEIRTERFAEVDRILDAAVADGAFPGAVIAVGQHGRLVHLAAHGRQTYDADSPAIAVDTLYDLASLTKVVATTAMAMILFDQGKLDLDAAAARWLPSFVGPGKDRVTVRHLLAHASGVAASEPLFSEISGRRAIVERIETLPLATEPGTKEIYSDLGIILLGEILERIAGAPLDRFVAEHVYQPLDMRDTLFRPPAALLARIAPTERDPWRGRVVHGEVHDENAFAMGGIAPHAGLFSTAPDLARFAAMMLAKGTLDGHRIVSPTTVELFTRRAGIVAGSDRALGWDTKSAVGSTAGTLFSPSSFGHTGFTGTSLWLDPGSDTYVVLLSNAIHTRGSAPITALRSDVATAVAQSLGLYGS